MSLHILEPAAKDFADATATPPFLYELGPAAARKVLDDVQAAPVAKPDVDEKWIVVPAEAGEVAVRIVRPGGSPSTARPRGWTAPASRSPATPWAAT